MQEAIKTKTPAEVLLELLITREKVEQHYLCYIEFERDHTTLSLFNQSRTQVKPKSPFLDKKHIRIYQPGRLLKKQN